VTEEGRGEDRAIDKQGALRSERDFTDHSLKAEREKTDDELANRRATVEEDADSVVRVARSRADALLDRARGLSDQRPTVITPEVADERRRADQKLGAERARADIALTVGLEARRQALQEVLRAERDATDARLLTERYRADDALATRDTFLAMVTHDLRTLLGGIVLTAHLLDKEAAQEPAPIEFVRTGAQRIERAAARMSRLIGDLVDVGSIEAGKLAVNPRRGEAGPLLREASEIFQASAAETGISLAVEGESSLAAVFDHDRILQVLANIVGNAVKFTPRGGRISIAVEDAEREIRFSVSDTGRGIPADKLDSIFERFVQLEDPVGRRGLGLGLYIAKSIVEAHHGTIHVQSALGRGSTFVFTLPAVEG
jgi:signal transduction histidine kinase